MRPRSIFGGASIAFLAAFAIGAALFFLGGADTMFQRVGMGLVFGSAALGIVVIVVAGLAQKARPFLSGSASGRARALVTAAGMFLVLGGAVMLMLGGVLAAVGYGGATIHDSGPGLDFLNRAGFAVVGGGLVFVAVRPPPNWEAAITRLDRRTQDAAEEILGTRVGRALLAVVGIDVGWSMLVGRSALVELVVVAISYVAHAAWRLR